MCSPPTGGHGAKKTAVAGVVAVVVDPLTSCSPQVGCQWSSPYPRRQVGYPEHDSVEREGREGKEGYSRCGAMDTKRVFIDTCM